MFTLAEIDLMIEALAARAARHESYGRDNPRNAAGHDRIAVAMRKLRAKLLRMKTAGKVHGIKVIPLEDTLASMDAMHKALKDALNE